MTTSEATSPAKITSWPSGDDIPVGSVEVNTLARYRARPPAPYQYRLPGAWLMDLCRASGDPGGGSQGGGGADTGVVSAPTTTPRGASWAPRSRLNDPSATP